MKKILLTILFLLSPNLFAMSYEDLKKEQPIVEKYESVFSIKLGDALDKKKIEELGLYIDKNDNEKKLSFYKSKKVKNELLGIPVSDVTFLVKEKKIVSVIIEYGQENNFTSIVKELNQLVGEPLGIKQNNEHFTYIWGIGYTDKDKQKKAVHSIVVNFDIYEQMGVIIWTDPKYNFYSKP